VLALAAALVPVGGDGGWTTVPAPQANGGWELAKPTHARASIPAATQPAAAPVVTSPAEPPPAAPVAKPAHHRRRHKPALRVARPQPALVRPQRTGAVLAARTTTTQTAYEELLVLAGLGLAIACFACGAAPAEQIRWRRGAAFVAYQRANITTAGVICLLAAAIVFALTRN
jgi:hypothetical protein